MSNVFSDQEDNVDTSHLDAVTLETLVGETQKYKTPDELAKAYAHLDAHLERVKADKVRMEAENKVLKELDESRRKTVEPQAPVAPKHDDPPVERQPEPKDDKDLSTLVREELDRSKKQDEFSGNVNSVSEKLAAHFGGAKEAQRAVANKAQELKVSTEWLMDIAGRSPTAFYNTIGLDNRSFNTPSSHGDLNTAALGQDRNRRNFKYYEEIRKNEPKAYYSAPLRKEMFDEARKQGDAFYT